jgi:predicted Zn finger-like uncharacterized protein
MIIQCEKCGTKFRFNATLMEEAGIWVRCSRCKNVFFEDISNKKLHINEMDRSDPLDGEIPSKVMEARKAARAEIERDNILKNAQAARPYEAPGYFEDVYIDKEEEVEEELPEEKVYKGRDMRKTGKPATYVLLSILVLAILALWLFPPVRDGALQGLSKAQQLIRNVTGMDNSPEQFNLAQLQFENVRQRYINNLFVGNMRVVEGSIINNSKFYISRIKVQGQLLDAYGVVLAEKESFCGNLLTDEELIIKTDDEIQKELSLPMGSNASNERVTPGGQIPFMIIFAREASGTIKTIVTLSGAERLLP